MTAELQVHLLPSLVLEEQLRGGVAVVIDVLRASTTITHALTNGAAAVVPTKTTAEAHAAAAFIAGVTLPTTDSEFAPAAREAANILLGGERGGTLIRGFDLDNSPASYVASVVCGKAIVFTTTNGTQALWKCRFSERVLIGCFTNLHALIELLANDSRPIHLVCAGTEGTISTDDALCAGAIATGIWATRQWPKWDGDELRLVLDLFTCRCQPMREFLGTLRESHGGRNLIALGLEADINRAARWDESVIVPEFHPTSGRIVPASDAPAAPKHILMAPRE